MNKQSEKRRNQQIQKEKTQTEEKGKRTNLIYKNKKKIVTDTTENKISFRNYCCELLNLFNHHKHIIIPFVDPKISQNAPQS